jgi:hypothetical protein
MCRVACSMAETMLAAFWFISVPLWSNGHLYRSQYRRVSLCASEPIDVGSQEVEVILVVEMLQTWHRRSLNDMVRGRIHKRRCMRHPS